MQIPILNGIFTDDAPDFRTSYPRNLIPVPKQTGIAAGYLRPADGIEYLGDGPGIDRGGINWNGICYRVMGTKLVKIDSNGSYVEIGDVGGSGQVSMDYSFDYLAIVSSGKLYLYNGSSLTQNTDVDLGTVLDMVWIDGYFMTTDGEFLVVTELGDPFSVNPLKYGSSEVNPDEIKGVLKLRNEVYAINRYTIEVFDNIGGDLFPFQRIDGAYMERGSVGTHAACVFMDSIAFLGGKLNEAPAIWIGSNGNTTKISTREIDQQLSEFTESQLEDVVLETRVDQGHDLLYIHLPNKTIVFDSAASRVLGQNVWFTLTTSIIGDSIYKAKNFVYCYDKWLVADPTSTKHGYLTDNISSHYGETNGWDFGTMVMYNEGRGAIVHELELVSLTGRVPLGNNPTVWSSYSTDGITWSQEKPRRAGVQGDRLKRLTWMRNGIMRNWRIQKFRGTSDTHISMTRLEAKIEPLAV